MPNLRSAAQVLTRATVVPGPKWWCTVSPLKVTPTCDVAAAMQMRLDAGVAGMVAHQAALIDRLVAVFEVDQGLLAETVLLDDRELDDGEGVVGIGFEMRDLADSFALVEDVDQRSWRSTPCRDRECAAPLPFSVPSPGDRKNRGYPERPGPEFFKKVSAAPSAQPGR